MRDYDWSRSSLGEARRWPPSLKTATAMMLNTLEPMFIAWGPELALLYNDAYAAILGHRHPAALGGSFKTVWADIWSEAAPLMEKVLAGKPSWRADLPLLSDRHGYPEQAYFTFSYSPLFGDDGEVAGMFSTCIETTGRVVVEQRLLQTAEALAASEERYRRQGERLFSLFEKAPGFVAVLEGPEHVVTLTNTAYRQIIGHRDVIGLPYRQARPELKGTGAFGRLDQVYASGKAFVGAGIRVNVQRTPGAPLEERFVDFIYQPIRNEAGQVTGIFLQGHDVTERELFVQQQALLLNELNHRVKNNLATVQSIAAQTARQAANLPSFIHDFEGRLIALARAHDALTRNAWSGADLHDLLRRELSDTFSARVQLEGPALQLNAVQAQAIGLIAHELATNAAKYGALSTAAGQVRVSWRHEAAGDRFSLEWVETGGPPVAPPKRRGFGSRLIAKLTTGDLAGTMEAHYLPEGLRLRLAAPIQPAPGS